MSGKIYNIISLVPQNGAKYVAMNLGYFTKKRKKGKILLVDMDFENPTLGYSYTQDSPYSIDNLMPIKDDLKKANLINNITQTKLGVDILKGSFMYSGNYIPPELTATILNLAKEEYDYIFVVTQSNLENANNVIALLNNDKVILVLRNNYSNALKITRFLENIKRFLKTEQAVNIIMNYVSYNNVLNISETIKNIGNANVNYLGILYYDTKSTDNKNLGEKNSFKRHSINDKTFKYICKKIL